MTVSTFLALARDLAGILAGASAIGAAAVFWSGGASAGVAAAAAAAAVGGAVGVAAIGALGLGGASPVTTLVAIAALCLALAAIGVQIAGPRGLWLALLAIGGVGLGALVCAAFARAGVLGPAGPLVALAALSVLAAGALGASASASRRAEAAQPEAAPGARAALSLSAATAPPAWFSAFYGRAFGGGADRPPDLAAAISTLRGGAALEAPGRWPIPASGDGDGDAARGLTSAPLRIPSPTAPTPRAFGAAGEPPRAASPARPDAPPFADRLAAAGRAGPLSAPTEAPIALFGDAVALGAPPRAPRAPIAVAAPAFAPRPTPPTDPAASALDGASRALAAQPVEPVPATIAASLSAAPRPERVGPPPPAPRTAAALVSIAGRPGAAAAIAPGARRSAAAQLDPTPTAPRAPRERLRTLYVCFPLLGAEADRFCALGAGGDGAPPLQPSDVEVRWRAQDGAAKGATDDVACFIDRNLANHVTLVVVLPTDPEAGLAARGSAPAQSGAIAGDAGLAMARGDAIYAATAQLIGAVRSQERGGQLYLSAFFANGAQLAGPWAAHAFGADRADRLFDIRSSGQTLDLLRRLKEETRSPRPAAAPGALAAAIAQAARERPQLTTRHGQSLLVALVDATAADDPDAADIDAIVAAARDADAPLFVIALTNGGAAPEGLAAAAEATGGAAYAAIGLDDLGAAMERVMLRAQGYCAVRLTAPPQLLSLGALELRVKRRMAGGCAFVQTARLSCGAVELQDSFEAADPARAAP